MTEILQVIVNLPLANGIFDYHVPPEFAGRVRAGCLVVVPFGAQRVQAVVLGPVAQAQVPETRPIEAFLDADPVLTAAQLELARWMAHETLAPLAACVQLMLPPGLSQQSDTLFTLTGRADRAGLTPFQGEVLDVLHTRGALRGRQLEAAFPHREWKPSLRTLVQKGYVLAEAVLPPPSVRPKVVRTAQLACPLESALSLLDESRRSNNENVIARREAALNYLAREGAPVNVSWVYASSGANLADLQRLAEWGAVILGETELWRDPLDQVEALPQEAPVLTAAQHSAWEGIRQAMQTAEPCLLHGVTGSGKTEIYLRAVEETLRQGKQAIVLVPEIGLTPQTVRRFMSRFAGRVGLVHSKMSAGERYDTWRRARKGDLSVIVGPRSALFSPLPNLGLIVVDECHDTSYYQADIQPIYHAVKAAVAYARLLKASVILGSATPTLEQYFQADREGWRIFSMPVRILAHRKAVRAQLSALGRDLPEMAGEELSADLPMPPVTIVDMREELKQGNRSMFSRALKTGLAGVLERGEQAILFLNRRGSSNYVFCRECGGVVRCPKCDLPLTAHEHDTQLRCHTCGYTRKMPAHCPVCNSNAIRPYGAGTEKVEADVVKLFPTARVLRWDAETTQLKGAHEILLSHFVHHRADILIGTQMLAKGLDLPLVTLVGAVLADVGLNLPDFRAAERGFQLLTQVAGRAGRSPLGGEAIFQTFQPEQDAIQFAARYDYAGFYQHELANRQRMGYPPYSRLTRLLFQDADPAKAQTAAETLARNLRGWVEGSQFSALDMIGPVPCYYARVNGQYRWQIILRGAQPDALIRAHLPFPDGWRIEVDPSDLL